jgi:uncharacterized protein (TIGR03000 family)
MYRTATTFSAIVLLTGATVLMTAGPVQAQRGGHGGGGHVGGYHGGGHGGGYHGGGYHHGGYYHGYGYRPYRGYRGYYGGYYPYYGYSGYYPYYDQSYLSGGDDSVGNGYTGDSSYFNQPLTHGSGYQGLSAQEYAAYARASAAGTASTPTPIDTTATITVSVPSDAEISFDGARTNSAGSVRRFQTPALTPGQRYNYVIRAQWSENGRKVTQSQTIAVTAGGNSNVTFPFRAETEIAGQNPEAGGRKP